MSAYKRLKAFAHWIKLEQDISRDEYMQAEDIEKVLAVVDAAMESIDVIHIDGGLHDSCPQCALAKKLKEIGFLWQQN